MRLDLTAGQVWTLSLGLTAGAVLLATSLPPVWERRGLAAPAVAAAPPPVTPPAGGLVSGLQPVPEVPPAPPAPPAAPEALALPPVAPPPAALPAAPPGPPSTPPPSSAPPPPRTELTVAEPLQVREAGYTSSAPEPGVPEGGLPVSARLGERVSTVHVRLRGSATLLTVPLSTASGANLRVEDARVRACRITTTAWQAQRPGPGVPFEPDDCVDGQVSATDVRFDLGVFPDRDGQAGFALVADLRDSTATSPRTFRLTLDPEDTA